MPSIYKLGRQDQCDICVLSKDVINTSAQVVMLVVIVEYTIVYDLSNVHTTTAMQLSLVVTTALNINALVISFNSLLIELDQKISILKLQKGSVVNGQAFVVIKITPTIHGFLFTTSVL